MEKMRFTARGLHNLKAIKSDVMAYAWVLARKEAKRTGCFARDCIAWALHVAWRVFRSLSSRSGYLRCEASKNHKEGYFVLGEDDGANLTLNFPHVFNRVYIAVNVFSGTRVICNSEKSLYDYVTCAWHISDHNFKHYRLCEGMKTPLYLL